MTELYLYPFWVRLWHWVNALLFLVLVASGVSLHYAGAKPWLVPFDTAVTVHNTAGILLTLAWLGFVGGNLLTGNGRHYRIRWRGLIGRTLAQARYYAYGIFRADPHPFHASQTGKFNSMQQLSYLGAMYGLTPLLILSGWAFLFSFSLPETLFGLGSLWVAATTHVLVSYLLVLFVVIHLYVITTGASVLANLRAMISGWHREPDRP